MLSFVVVWILELDLWSGWATDGLFSLAKGKNSDMRMA